MSLQRAAEFTVVVTKDLALSSQVTAALKGKSPQACAAAFAEIGKSKGYEFTAAEAAEAREKMLTLTQLSEGDLDKVAAGGNTVPNGYSPVFVQFGMQQAFAALFPGGGPIGAGAGAAINTAVSGGSSSDIGVAFINGLNDALDSTRSVVQTIFSGW